MTDPKPPTLREAAIARLLEMAADIDEETSREVDDPSSLLEIFGDRVRAALAAARDAGMGEA